MSAKPSQPSTLAADAGPPLEPKKQPGITPRLLRFRDAPRYLGMDRNRFNAEVRPYLTVIPIGRQGVAFDRLELDAWVDHYKSRNGRPGLLKGDMTWDENEPLDSSDEAASGTSINRSEVRAFAKALARATSGKLKPTLRNARRN